MTAARWLRHRAWILTSTNIDLEIAHQPLGPAPARAALASRHLADTSNSLRLYHRYEMDYDRQFHRAVSGLFALRAHNNTKPTDAPIPDVMTIFDPDSDPAPEAKSDSPEQTQFPVPVAPPVCQKVPQTKAPRSRSAPGGRAQKGRLGTHPTPAAKLYRAEIQTPLQRRDGNETVPPCNNESNRRYNDG
jgi:hypothetical protein